MQAAHESPFTNYQNCDLLNVCGVYSVHRNDMASLYTSSGYLCGFV